MQFKQCTVPGCPNRFPEHHFCNVCGADHTPQEIAASGNAFDQQLLKRKSSMVSPQPARGYTEPEEG